MSTTPTLLTNGLQKMFFGSVINVFLISAKNVFLMPKNVFLILLPVFLGVQTIG